MYEERSLSQPRNETGARSGEGDVRGRTLCIMYFRYTVNNWIGQIGPVILYLEIYPTEVGEHVNRDPVQGCVFTWMVQTHEWRHEHYDVSCPSDGDRSAIHVHLSSRSLQCDGRWRSCLRPKRMIIYLLGVAKWKTNALSSAFPIIRIRSTCTQRLRVA